MECLFAIYGKQQKRKRHNNSDQIDGPMLVV